MIAPTSSARCRFRSGFGEDLVGRLAGASGHSTLLRSGGDPEIGAAEIGEASGISLALGESAAVRGAGLVTVCG
jgi:hypothetical protein